MNPDDPAIREATEEEAQFDEVTFVEGEEELSVALEDAQEVASERAASLERMRSAIRELANNPNADVGAIIAGIGDPELEASLAGQLPQKGGPPHVPAEPNPKETGTSSDPGKRDTSFTQQGVSAKDSVTGQNVTGTDPGTSAIEDDAEDGESETFDPDEAEDGTT
jgi:hypothetical protein